MFRFPLSGNIFKINFDTTTDYNRSRGSSAVLTRDSSEKSWFRHYKNFENIFDPLSLECLYLSRSSL